MCCQVFTTSFRVVSQAAVLSGSYSGPRHGSTYLLRELGPLLALSLWALFVDPGGIVFGDKIYLVSSRREGELPVLVPLLGTVSGYHSLDLIFGSRCCPEGVRLTSGHASVNLPCILRLNSQVK